MKMKWIFFLGVAAVLWSVNAAEWKTEGNWKASDNGTYLLKNTPGAWCGYFTGNAETRKGKHYQLDFSARNQAEPDSMIVCIQGPDRRLHREFVIDRSTDAFRLYWMAKEDGNVKITFHFRCKKELDVVLAKLSWQEVKAGENLFVDPDCETSSAFAVDWTARKAMTSGNESGFGIGKHCLCLKEENQKGASAVGCAKPIYPGKTMELRFVAKGTPGAILRCWITCWSPFKHQGKAFWASRNCKLTADWKEYSFKTQISSDFKRFPDLADGLGQAGFYLLPGGGEVMIDNLFFGVVPEK